MRITYLKNQKGFSFVEMLVVVLLVTIIFMAGFLLFTTGQVTWVLTDTKIRLQENLRLVLERLSIELSESGRDSSDTLQVTILDGSGVNNSDILRFAIPLCLCGKSVMDTSAEIATWGAPLEWGDTGCQTTWSVNENGKVVICHVPPGNPDNPQTLEVAPSAVNAHLAHGDWIGDCSACDPNTYNNRTIEYLLDTNGRLLRRVLDGTGGVLNSRVLAEHMSHFQVSINQKVVTAILQASKATLQGATMTLTESIEVMLRNYD